MIRTFASTIAAALLLAIGAAAARTTLDIYFIDVEGGQSTLFVTPAGESLLVDTGFPGERGGFDAAPGDPSKARDANRILAAARDAGISRIEYLLMTHFHADHDGGVVELADLLPIRTFVDHGGVRPEAERVAGTLKAFERYAAVRATGRHIEPEPGGRLPLKGVDVTIVSSAGSTIVKPLSGAGSATDGCADAPPPAEEPTENPRSTGFQLRFGRFRVLDVGDLSGAPLFALACPRALVGPVDLYVVAHHGGGDAADPATFAAFRPRIALVNNGARKGGAPPTLAALHAAPGVDTWQLHRSDNPGVQNADAAHIANLDETTAHWIKVSARENGSFTVTNARTGMERKYEVRSKK